MRMLITGSRDWDDEALISYAISARVPNPAESTLVSGACPTGADMMCERVARDLGMRVERHPAEWNAYGKRAGFVRNAEMVALGADLCLAFIRNESRGATHTANLAEKAGIPTLIYRRNV